MANPKCYACSKDMDPEDVDVLRCPKAPICDSCAGIVSLDRKALQRAYDKYSLAKYLAYDAPDLPSILAIEDLAGNLLRMLK